MSELIIKDGQFYRDGQVVPPVIGDAEQIACLRRYEKREENLKNGVDVDISYHIQAEAVFKCFCGRSLTIETDSYQYNEDDAYDDLPGKTTTCWNCRRKYELIENVLEGEINAVLVDGSNS